MTDNDPVAWAVVYPNYIEPWEYEDDARESASDDHDVIPLYRSPTLTDAEREAIETAIATLDAYRYPTLPAAAATIRKLLERME